MTNNLQVLREFRDLKQSEIALILDVPRTTYISWERSDVMLPLRVADRLSIFYKVSLGCILGLNNNFNEVEIVKKIDYKKLKENLVNLKKEYGYTYQYLAKKLNCSLRPMKEYYANVQNIPIDRLIMMSKLFKVDIDVLCGKKKDEERVIS